MFHGFRFCITREGGAHHKNGPAVTGCVSKGALAMPSRRSNGRLQDGPTWRLGAGLLLLLASACTGQATDLRSVPFWDGETSPTPDGPLINRYGGPPIHLGGTKTRVSHTTGVVHSGSGALRIDTTEPIGAGDFGFFQTALTGFGPSPAYVTSRDINRFDATSFWLRNTTGSPFTLKFETKDDRDSGSHTAFRRYSIPAGNAWRQITVPLDLNQPGWTVVGNPDLQRARFLGFVIDANQGAAVTGSIYLDDMVFVEPGPPLDPATAPLNVVAARIARRQFDGLWGSRSRTNGLLPANATFADLGALNVTSAMLNMLPGAVGRGWVLQAEADAYVTQLVGTFETIMDRSTYVPPRYVDWVTLAPTGVAEESSVDAAFLALALHQYKSLPTTSTGLRTAIDGLENRIDLAAFSDTEGPRQGWKLAYHPDTESFTEATYDGYSGEPWVISLAAELSEANHVPITQHYHSATLRVKDYLVDPERAHLVHALSEYRAPFVQWLLPLFVDVADRGIDTYPDRSLAANPLRNAVRYQQEVDAKLAELGRSLFAQPDAGDDGSGTFFRQFSLYNDQGRGDLFMPWSAALGLLGDPEGAGAALRNSLAMGLGGPLGLADSVQWATGAPAPDQLTARQDFWNTALSTMALLQYLYDGNAFFTSLPEVQRALAQVFLPLGDMDFDGDVDFDDIGPLVFGLNNAAGYQAKWLQPPVAEGDLNFDGDFDFDDIGPLVGLLTGDRARGRWQGVPEPAARMLALLAVVHIVTCRWWVVPSRTSGKRATPASTGISRPSIAAVATPDSLPV